MKKSALYSLYGTSLSMSTHGFILDANKKVEILYLNLFEISTMSLFTLGILIGITKMGQLVKRRPFNDSLNGQHQIDKMAIKSI